MKRLLILLTLLLLAGAWLGQAMIEDTGYVLIAYKQTSIETSIWVLCIAAILLFSLTYLVINLLTHLRSPLDRLREWNQIRTERKAETKAYEGLIARSDGDWWKARRLLLQAAKTSHAPTIYYLEAAEMASLNDDYREVSRILDSALKAVPQATLPVQLCRAQLALKLGHDEQAQALVDQQLQHHPSNIQLKRLQAQLLLRRKNWSSLYPLIAELKRAKAISDAEAKTYRRKAGIGLLDLCLSQFGDRSSEHLSTELRKCWNNLSFDTQQDNQVRSHYLQLLLQQGSTEEAQKLLTNWLSKDLDEQLLLRFSELPGADPDTQLKTAKSWLKQHPDNAALELCLARLSQRIQLWGAAIAHYRRSLELEPHAQTLLELAELYFSLGEKESATQLMHNYNQPLNLPIPTAADRDIRTQLLE